MPSKFSVDRTSVFAEEIVFEVTELSNEDRGVENCIDRVSIFYI